MDCQNPSNPLPFPPVLNLNDGYVEYTIDRYPWDSEEQKQGYLGLISYMKRIVKLVPMHVMPALAFFIQKDIDAHVYWRELVGTQITDLQNQIMVLKLQLFEEVVKNRRGTKMAKKKVTKKKTAKKKAKKK